MKKECQCYNYHYKLCQTMPYACMSLNKQNSEYGKVLQMTRLSICKCYTAYEYTRICLEYVRICQNMPLQSSEYLLEHALTEF